MLSICLEFNGKHSGYFYDCINSIRIFICKAVSEINLAEYDFEGGFLPKCIGDVFVYAHQNARRAIYEVMKCHQFTVVIEARDCAR